jgi:MSHA biogenesis protein MshI
MRWPWNRRKQGDSLVVSWSGQTLAYVRARLRPDGGYEVVQLGVERQGADGDEDFLRRLHDLGFKGLEVHVMLRPEQYHLLQIDAPAVAPEEMRAAARWQIRDMIDLHMDDITLDVMRVGSARAGQPGQLFVVVASNTVIAETLRLGQAMQWNVPVIDIQENAQRNLQTLVARRDGRVERANAALVLTGEQQALLTIAADGELYYARRIDLSPGLAEKPWPHPPQPQEVSAEQASPAAAVEAADDEGVQRFVVEVQRSLDVWDRTWSDLPLDGLWVEAGGRTAEMASWLTRELGFSVNALAVDSFFPGFDRVPARDRAQCLPLLGVLLRAEERNL